MNTTGLARILEVHQQIVIMQRTNDQTKAASDVSRLHYERDETCQPQSMLRFARLGNAQRAWHDWTVLVVAHLQKWQLCANYCELEISLNLPMRF